MYDFSGGFGVISNALQNIGKQNERAWQQKGLAALGQDIQSGNYAGAAQKAMALGDTSLGVNLLGLGQKAQERDASNRLIQSWGGGASGPAAAPVALGNPNEIESRFVDTVKGAGLTNPVGLGAVAAYGKAESGFSPQNVNRTWSDPSESGQPGTAGGIMSWRAERLQNLQNFARQRGEAQPSVETQALFLAQENPQLIPALQAAKTPQEANQIMANAWRFAGYNRPGGENARREALTTQYAQRFGGAQGQPAPAIPVQVAENEADVQRLEAQQGNPVVPQPAPVQVAQAPGGDPTMPAPGAAYAEGFAIPQGQAAQATVENDRGVQLWQQRYNQAAAAGNERAMKIAEKNLDMATKSAERRYNEGKAPEAIREWQYARQNGLTTAGSPVAYAKEQADATRKAEDETAPLRKEIQQLPSYKNLAQAAPIYRSMYETAGRDTKASDLNLIYGLGKIMDPTSVVREGEMALAQGTSGLDQRLAGYASSIMGGAALTPETREALMAEAYSRMDTYRQQFDQDGAQYRGIVQRRGLNADDIIPNVGEYQRWERPKASPPPASTPAPQRPVDQQYVRPDGSSPPVPGPAAPPLAPKRGALEEGFRFKGGDPRDEKNWVKVK